MPEAKDFTTYDPKKIPKYRTVPPKTLAYYKEQIALGKRPLSYRGVPYILYNSTLDVSDFEIAEI